jgi:hypothetical protein
MTTTIRDETLVQTNIRVEATRLGIRLFRNNVGAGKLANGSFLRWGLCNETSKINSQFKSGDLIGFRELLITQDMVGGTIAQFVSREVKHSNWKPDPKCEREAAQRRWMDLVNSHGGDAAIVTGPGSFETIRMG